jgi:hypothetical protein
VPAGLIAPLLQAFSAPETVPSPAAAKHFGFRHYFDQTTPAGLKIGYLKLGSTNVCRPSPCVFRPRARLPSKFSTMSRATARWAANYAKMTDGNTDAMVAYLCTVPPQE